MRFIFTDEAGISAQEHYTIVVGILVDVDEELIRAETSVRDVLGAVPLALRNGFVFSSKDVWDGRRYADTWLVSDRIRFLENMMAIPRRNALPLAIAVIPREANENDIKDVISRAKYHHAAAFAQAMSRADKYIREEGRVGEIGTIIAEDVDKKMKAAIRQSLDALRKSPVHLKDEHIHRTQRERDIGYITQQTETRVSRIRKTIHFVEKDEELLIYVADACAYGIRAYLTGKPQGDQFLTAIGVKMPKEDWGTVGGFSVFKPPRR